MLATSFSGQKIKRSSGKVVGLSGFLSEEYELSTAAKIPYSFAARGATNLEK